MSISIVYKGWAIRTSSVPGGAIGFVAMKQDTESLRQNKLEWSHTDASNAGKQAVDIYENQRTNDPPTAR